jgi:hypothetical protein
LLVLGEVRQWLRQRLVEIRRLAFLE